MVEQQEWCSHRVDKIRIVYQRLFPEIAHFVSALLCLSELLWLENGTADNDSLAERVPQPRDVWGLQRL